MSSCPQCGQTIEAEFGVLNCPSCSVMLSVNMDGSISLADEAQESESPIQNEQQEQEADFQSNESSWSQESFQPSEDFSESPEPESPSLDNDFEEPFLEEAGGQQEPAQELPQEEEQESSAPAKESPEPSFQKENSENVFEEKEEEFTRILEGSGYKDVEAFGNSELSSSPTGGIVYDLMIEGIDTKEIREEIRIELKNRRYRLDSESLLKSIHNGKLVIKGLNPAKTALLVNHLKHLDVEIQWKQNEIIRM